MLPTYQRGLTRNCLPDILLADLRTQTEVTASRVSKHGHHLPGQSWFGSETELVEDKAGWSEVPQLESGEERPST